ncbi:MAG TPA: hypothetical protein VFT72_18195 [Opitutaceae bacterium]|nr:hypothetical protein [Opitutaceae bacterium]
MHFFRRTPLALVLICAGCSALPHSDPAKSGPFFTPRNVTVNTPRLPALVRRVTVLPVHGLREMTEDSVNRVNEAVVTQLNQTGRFEVVTLTPDNLRSLIGQPSLGSADALPHDLLEKVKKTSGSDAVLFTDVTAYSPYPPLTIGLRMKLVELSTGTILWAADNIFAASDPSVANSARHFAFKLGSDRGPADLSHTVLQNPSRFCAYAADATFETLPPR